MLKHRRNRTKHPIRRVLIVVEGVDTVEGVTSSQEIGKSLIVMVR
jgi:hypothetical protein